MPGPPPRKPRPRALWFALPIALILLGVTMIAAGAIFFGKSLMHTDATIARDGTVHELSLNDTEERLLWAASGEARPDCTVVDSGSEEALPLTAPGGSFTRSRSGPEMRGIAVFKPRSTSLEVSCVADGGSDVEIGKAPPLGKTFGGFFGGIFGGLAVAGLGGIWLIILLVLFFSRPKRA